MLNDASPIATPLSRRTFIKWTAASAALVTPPLFLDGCATTPVTVRAPGQPALPADQAAVFEALAPVILDRAPSDTQGISKAIDDGIGSFGPINEAQFSELLDLLTLSPTRALVGGLWSDWPDASREDLADFLDGWRYSSSDCSMPVTAHWLKLPPPSTTDQPNILQKVAIRARRNMP